MVNRQLQFKPNISGEKWKETEVPTYFISDYGNIKRKLPNGRWRYLSNKAKDRYGYPRCTLNHKYFSIHRLVAIAFVPNPDDLPVVSHINGNKADNRAENLEWTTLSGNMKHATNYLPNKSPKPVVSISKDYKTITAYPSIMAAMRETGAGGKEIVKAARSWETRPENPLSAKGVYWHYLDASRIKLAHKYSLR